jgi:Zn-dependent M28 family amino/carboxypeptidase
MAHYDSVQTGPGAGDNGSGVVTLLETLRALQSSAPLRNNVVFVFSEGEEDGGLGSQAFVDEHPLAKDVSVAIVPDSNGCGRAAIGVFDRHNGWLVRGIAGSVPHALAASISDELGKLA